MKKTTIHSKEDIEELASDFESCQKTLCAIGDENRQHLILEMMKMGECSGVRVGEITEKIHMEETINDIKGYQ